MKILITIDSSDAVRFMEIIDSAVTNDLTFDLRNQLISQLVAGVDKPPATPTMEALKRVAEAADKVEAATFRKLSAESHARMSAAQRKRWAKARKGK